ncbi:hypothetical protein M514_05531 [Trichuris suis]|uniref:Uncharacterized protein n=1 Tax=Trichuris suis TaxID=68888 RepID=A0A085MZG6_9BILA|nr:hypothetical protein M513_05531 [Trichuris suis]KFD62612.1 hypothetical protein M514_05531 [Trichuris suis]
MAGKRELYVASRVYDWNCVNACCRSGTVVKCTLMAKGNFGLAIYRAKKDLTLFQLFRRSAKMMFDYTIFR